ncbi:hypothetical protein V1264_001340 [Littorina saxatilis]|uniref:28S ribosomal protein S17, mitochondrial n=1 Tax=Littorina saxatilis TaxID=31220 RepID=A0AAN9C246_9CAEN
MSKWGMLVIGQVLKRGTVRPDTVKVRCLKMKLDNHLNKYFNGRKHYWAVEGDIKTDIGDIILIERLPEKLTPLVTHEIKEQVFKIGAVVDPVTGNRCRGTIFIDEELRQLEAEQIEEEREKKASRSST